MKRLTHVLALFLMVAALPALASSDKAAKALYEKGKAAEARQDYIAAYNFYHQAWELKPSELRYRAAAEYVRFLASASYVHQGELLVNAGKLQEALTDFEQALAIDPSSFIAQQQANKVRQILVKSQKSRSTSDHAIWLNQAHGRGNRTGRVGAHHRPRQSTLKLSDRHQDGLRDRGQAGRHQRALRPRLYVTAPFAWT